MSTLKEIMQTSYYDQATGTWKPYLPETDARGVKTADGSTVQAKLDALPGQLSDAVTVIKGGVDVAGDSLKKLYDLITAIQTVLNSDDVTLDTVQEIVDFIKTNKSNLELLGANKVNVSDVVNNLTTVIDGKVLDARQGKVLKDAIDSLQTALSGLQTDLDDFATKTYVSTSIASAMPHVGDMPPANPIDHQLWLKPVGTIEVA